MSSGRNLPDPRYREFWNAVEAAAHAADLWPPPWISTPKRLYANHRPPSHGLFIDASARRVFLDGKEVSLTPNEFRLLAHLHQRLHEAVSLQEMFDVVTEGKPSDFYSGIRTINTHVNRLRQKLGADVIVTVRGFGYRLNTAHD